MRNTRYCELLLINPGTDATTIYNTTGLNDCPTDQWNAINADQLASEAKVQSVDKNGPRFWVADQILLFNTGAISTFGGIQMRQVGTTTVSGNAPTPYTLNKVTRVNEWWYRSGDLVYELIDPQGNTYVMQTFSHTVDPNLKMSDLRNLGYRLKLPKGWEFQVEILAQDLGIEAHGTATTVQDDLGNTYQQK